MLVSTWMLGVSPCWTVTVVDAGSPDLADPDPGPPGDEVSPVVGSDPPL